MSEDIGRGTAGDGPAGLPPGPAACKAHRQRRPTGAPPPLPHPATITTTAWLVLAAVVLAAACVAAQGGPWLRVDDQAGTWVLRQLAVIRTPWLTHVANQINAAGSGWGASVLAFAVIALTIAFRRGRHLAVFVGGLVFLEIAGRGIYSGLSRPRPYGVPIIGSWAGYASAWPPTVILTFCLMGIVYCLAVPGRARSRAKAAAAAVVAVFGLARLYLAVDHPDDVLLGAAIAVALAVTAFRYFTPSEVFPVAYRRGRTAHVDVTGRRGEAIRQAVADQLGLDVTEIKPVGLESSAGSTPLRLRVQGGPEQIVFAKLYTKGHVRADRWYKLGRSILYGTMEDETPFKTVRRLVRRYTGPLVLCSCTSSSSVCSPRAPPGTPRRGPRSRGGPARPSATRRTHPGTPGRSSVACCSAGTSSSTRRPRTSSRPPSGPRFKPTRPGCPADARVFPLATASRCSDLTSATGLVWGW